MGLGQLDSAVRVSGIAIILILAWLLFRQRERIGLASYLFLPMALCLSGFLVGNTPDPSLRLSGAPGAIAHFASGCAVIFLWWFCLACFDRQFRPRGAILMAGIGWLALATADRLITEPVPVLSYLLIGLGLGIVAHLIWRLYTEREGDLIQQRYDARALVALLLGGLLLVDLLVDLVLGFAWRPLPFAMAQNIAILGFSIWLAAQVLGVRSGVLSFDEIAPNVLAPPPAEATSGDWTGDDELRSRLIALIEVDRVHLDPDLSFAMFAQLMRAPERTVRRLVNHALGFDHFRSFLNHYRLLEARAMLADPHRSADKLIAIALDSGFASLPSFNRVFRAAEGCTPGQFRDAAIAARSASADGSRESALPKGFEQRTAVF